MNKTVIVLSGGMDSTTLLYKLIDEGKQVVAISFDYGQRHKKELEMAKETCDKLKIPHRIIDLSCLKELISNSALTSDVAVPEGHYADENMKLTVVPNRNMIMASIAIGWAVNSDYDEVALGVHAGDHAIYPDCRPEFIDALRRIADISNFKSIKIYTPFLYLSKGDIAKVGKVLKVDYSLTLTCYNGESIPCGKCGSCVERKEAFEFAGLEDPLVKQFLCETCYRKFSIDKIARDSSGNLSKMCSTCKGYIGKGPGYSDTGTEEDMEKWFNGIKERKEEIEKVANNK